MPTTYQPRTATNNQTAAVLSDLQRCVVAIFRIELLRKEAGEFVAFGDINVDHPDSGPIPADELFADVLRAVQAKADQDGGEWFKVIAWSAPNVQGVEKPLVERSFKLNGLTPSDAPEGDRRTAESNAIVRTNDLLLTVIDRMGARYDTLMGIACKVPEANVEVIKSFPKNLENNASFYNAMQKKWEMDREDKREVREFEEFKFKIEKAIRAIELIAPYLIGDSGVKPTPGKPPFVGKVHAFYASLKPDEREKLIPIVGAEALRVFEAAGNAATDQEGKAIIRKLEQVWEGQEPMVILTKAAPIIGKERFADLVAILTAVAATS